MCLLAVGLLAGCTEADDRRQAATGGSISETTSPAPSFPAASSESPTPPADALTPSLTVTSIGDEPTAGRFQDTTVMVGDGPNGAGVAVAMDAGGDRVWTVHEPEGNDIPTLRAVVDGDVTVLTWEVPGDTPWPGRTVVRAVDTITGQTLWSTKAPSFATTMHGTTYTSRCRPVQNGKLGNCTVSARDSRVGQPPFQAPGVVASTSWYDDDASNGCHQR